MFNKQVANLFFDEVLKRLNDEAYEYVKPHKYSLAEVGEQAVREKTEEYIKGFAAYLVGQFFNHIR